MRTEFTPEQLRNEAVKESNDILRKCVHCGFCLATCPTYRLSGSELESPRGRIYLIKEMLEHEHTPSAEVVRHVDQCLSCLSCMTTCPSGVDYMHLIDHGRARIETLYRRSPAEKIKRRFIAALLPYPRRFRLVLRLGRLAGRLQPFLPVRLRNLAELALSPSMAPARTHLQTIYPPQAASRGHVGLLPGCVQQATDNGINEATIRVLNRIGYQVHILSDSACCGAIEHHLGKSERARARVAKNIRLWRRVVATHGLQAIIVNASGCGTMLKDYGHILAGQPDLAEDANIVSRMCCDITEFLDRPEHAPPPSISAGGLRIAYQNPCSMQHGQGITEQPAHLLTAYGYEVLPVKDAHLCCGSAGTYNLLHPDIAAQLGRNKAGCLEAERPDAIATGNLGCLTQLRTYTDIPIVHTVQLLDWAGGGPDPLPG
jgi:glycolate oxidase iron-sulfur subunit